MKIEEAKSEATRIAAEYGENCYIADCKVYTDEFEDGPYIIGSREVFSIMFPYATKYGKIVAVVSPKGEYFTNDVELALQELKSVLPVR